MKKELSQIAKDYAEEVMQLSLKPEHADMIKENEEDVARKCHEEWLKEKQKNGWKLGPDDKEKKTNPNLVPYDKLDEETKEANRAGARTLLSLMAINECVLIRVEDVTHYFAKQLHDAWSQQKIKDGWKWGEKTDKSKKIHACLVPFEDLSKEDQSYDWITAEGIVKGLPSNMMFVSLKLSDEIIKLSRARE